MQNSVQSIRAGTLVIADNSPASTLGQKDSSNDYGSSSKVTITCQSSRPSDRPLVTEMQLVPDAGFVDPGYSRTENREHLGTDFQAVGGACVYAVRDGKVVENAIANDPMRAVVKIEHADGSKAIYGHIESSVGFGTVVTRGTLLGTVRHPTANYPGFSSHLHLGEWTKPSDKSVQSNEEFDRVCMHTGKDPWGWGRAPSGTTREQILKCGWVDLDSRYRTEVQANRAEPKVSIAPNSITVQPNKIEPPGRLVYETCFQMECFKQYLVTTRRNNDGLMLGRVATKPYWNDFYSGNQYKEDRAARNLLPISYHNYKVSCKIPGGYIESEEGGERIPQPERYVSHATEGDFKIWKAVCEGMESGAISGETDAILRTVANSGLCPPSYGRTKIGKVIEKYATAICICTKEPDCDNATAYLKKVDNKWVLVDHGTGIFPENLIQYGFPKNIAYALTRP